MAPRPHYSPDTMAACVELVRAGHSCRAAAERYGVRPRAVMYGCTRAGVRSQHYHATGRTRYTWPQIRAALRLFAQGVRQADVGRQTRIPTSTLWYWRRRYGRTA